MLDAAPQPLDEDVVQGPAAPVHADRDAVRFGDPGKRIACELAALVGIGDLRLHQSTAIACHKRY